ncbi:class I SAM-dependent methyltransferase [Nostoc sp. MG11]|uniref:class I SAM-dependent methyltransferase n=1 Tax=Nostoc sp. MG11 TaxID=2721166 RepID=UPI00186707A1|nr:methyltransferase domain-containing protein [Nostoc sp. MG11]
MSETVVRQQYDQMAHFYDQRWNTYITKTLTFLKAWAHISPQATILDVACGTGEFEHLLLNDNPTQQIMGVDISENMLLVAKQKCRNYPNVSFSTASASALPFSSSSFDVVVSANAFHYFDDPDAAFAEMKRVLKPDGKLIILDWCRDYILCKICDILLKIFDSGHKQCYSQAQFHQLLTSSNFEICGATKVRLGLIWGLMLATATPNI